MVSLSIQASILRSVPRRAVIGLALISIAWPLAWFGQDLVSHTFFPLWLGYVLVVDGIVFLRTGTSPFARSRAGFSGLFLVSIPLWWAFELFNVPLRNWEYVLPHTYGWWRYRVEASLAFSTVLPALLVTAELWRSRTWVQRCAKGPRFAPSTPQLALISTGGAMMTALSLIWPTLFFPLIWIGAFLFLDPINRWLGAQNLNEDAAGGKWDRAVAWGMAGLTCGWFWEMWNVFSMPKWRYTIPWADWLHIFEMPLLGYGGYIPFALEVFAVTALAAKAFPAIRHCLLTR